MEDERSTKQTHSFEPRYACWHRRSRRSSGKVVMHSGSNKVSLPPLQRPVDALSSSSMFLGQMGSKRGVLAAR